MKTSRKWTAVGLFLGPPLILYAMFVIYPAFNTFRYSFFKWKGIGDKVFIGLENFNRLVSDQAFWRALANNVEVLAITIILSTGFALFFATLLAKKIRGSNFYRSTWLFPNMLGDVVIATLWLFIYHPTIGMLNGLLKVIGLDQFVTAWLGNSTTALIAVTVPLVWKFMGFYILLFLGGIQSIPTALYDAARVDGASELQKFRHVTLPLLKQTIAVALVFMIYNSFNVIFAFVNIMTDGGPAGATEVIPTYLYKQAFEFRHFGYSSAIGLSMVILMFILASVVIQTLMRETTRSSGA